MADKYKTVLYFLGILLFCFGVFVWLYPRIHPFAGINPSMDLAAVKVHARTVADQLGFESDGYNVSGKFEMHSDLIRQAQVSFGLERSNQLFRNALPVYRWRIDWRKQGDDLVTFGSDEEVEEIIFAPSKDLSMTFDMHGNLIWLKSGLADTLRLPSLDEVEARTLTERFIIRYSAFTNERLQVEDYPDTALRQSGSESGKPLPLKLHEQKKTLGPVRTDHQFTYQATEPYTENPLKLDITVSGNVISSFNIEHNVPEEYRDYSDTVAEAGQLISLLVFVVLVPVVGFKRIRAYEIGFKIPLIFAMFIAVCYAVTIYLQMDENDHWESMIGILIGPLFIALAFFVLWAVTEAIGRERWKDKFSSFDLLLNGHLLHSKIGESIIRGIAIGLGLLAIWLLILALLDMVAGIFIYPVHDNNSFMPVSNPVTYLVFDNIGSQVFLAATFIVFTLSFLRRYIESQRLLVGCGALIWGIALQGYIYPWYLGIPVEMLIGAILVLAFLRYDFITILVALVSYQMLYYGLSLFYFDYPSAMQSAYGLIFLGASFTIFGLVALLTRDKFTNLDEISPEFVLNVTERQRLQGELAVAREVQMSFLPDESPQLAGLEISSRCLPALEVGGDYYDFMELGENRLGVVIGDVSGKGTQAAFYMTLTKGFLKALAATFPSPAELLVKMNQLFCDNVERGHFISLLYAIIDLNNRTMIIARAGHNPLVVKHSGSEQVEFFDQTGMAMGLENGELFEESMRDSRISFKTGDFFVFYTDGFTEAMNKRKEEFGEERFLQSIEKRAGRSAAEMLEGVISDVDSFAGKAPQQDDMTMVIVKIT